MEYHINGVDVAIEFNKTSGMEKRLTVYSDKIENISIKEARKSAGLSQARMSALFEIPKRTIENWESGVAKCPEYVRKLIVEKLLQIKKMEG